MSKTLFYVSLLNSIYIVTNLLTYSDSIFNAPLGLTTLIAIVLLVLNNRLKKTAQSTFIKITEVLSYINILIGLSLIVFI